MSGVEGLRMYLRQACPERRSSFDKLRMYPSKGSGRTDNHWRTSTRAPGRRTEAGARRRVTARRRVPVRVRRGPRAHGSRDRVPDDLHRGWHAELRPRRRLSPAELCQPARRHSERDLERLPFSRRKSGRSRLAAVPAAGRVDTSRVRWTGVGRVSEQPVVYRVRRGVRSDLTSRGSTDRRYVFASAFSTMARAAGGRFSARAASCPGPDIFFQVLRRMSTSLGSSCWLTKSAK